MSNITDEMIEREYQYWVNQCTKSDPLDREKTKKAVTFCRKMIDLPTDVPVYFVDGPLSAYYAQKVLDQKEVESGSSLPSQDDLEKEVSKLLAKTELGEQIRVDIDYDVSKWVSWVAFYKMGLDYEFPEEWKNFQDFREYCDDVVLYVDGMINKKAYTIAVERPLFYKTETRDNQLHCEDGPAVEFRDGSKAFFLNGYRVPGWVYRDERNQSFAKRVLSIENTDVRSEIINLVGPDLFYEMMDKKELDVNEIDGRPYSLYDVTLKGSELGRFLRMTGPSTGKPYFERVHDECETVIQANAWADNQVDWRNKYIKPSILT